MTNDEVDAAVREIARRFVIDCLPKVMREMRRLDLRAQARRKGRPGWRRRHVMQEAVDRPLDSDVTKA